MKRMRIGGMFGLIAVLSACGGDGGGGGSVLNSGNGSGTPIVTPTPTAGCSLSDRQSWVDAQMREWYLFPETLPASLNKANYSTVSDYLDALTATARAQGRDRYFTYLTSIAEENAYYSSGSSAGFGFRLAYDSTARRLFITESFEGAPALAAGVDRGAEIVGIGTSASNIRTVSAIVAAEGTAGLNTALGPDTTGTTRYFRITDASGTRDVSIAKSDFNLTPVSSRYGAKVIADGGRTIGYINLRTFISTADPALRQAFANFRAQGITNLIVDLRYNGGGALSISELMGDLMGANRSTSEVYDYVSFRPEKASNNTTKFFAPQPESIAPTKIAFIGTGGTASASELVINAFIPYLHANAALIGTNTYGKPVGQIALDKPGCDDRLRAIALSIQNSARNGNYYNGLASSVEASCRATDDLSHPLGDPQESSTRQALDYLAGRSCTPIGASASASASASTGASAGQADRTTIEADRELLSPDRPSTAQREVPGLF